MSPFRKLSLGVVGLLVAGAVAPLGGQTPPPAGGPGEADVAAYRAAAAAADADLRTALEELAAVRARIAGEKPEVAVAAERIASELRVKRRQAELARQERDALVHDLQALSRDVARARDERNYLDGLLAEFRKQWEAEVHPAEAAALAEAFAAADQGGDAGLAARAGLAETAASRIRDFPGLRVVEGQALDPDGTLLPGRFVVAGPTGWFVSSDGKASGLTAPAEEGLGSRIVPGTADAEGIRRAADGAAAALAWDPTLGSAVALDASRQSVVEHFRDGGLWMYPILALGVAAMLGGAWKWLQLAGIRDLPARAVGEILEAVRQGRRDDALQAADRLRHPARKLLRRGIELSGGNRTRDEIEEALYETYLEVQPPLLRGLPVIAITSAAAPLLGLLGTVTGMIHTFNLINVFGTGDAKSLASGISEALITTEFGLVVAIPALILHAFLSRRVQGIRAALEMTSIAFLNGMEERAA
jgi:biopolymer transport protein ExbB